MDKIKNEIIEQKEKYSKEIEDLKKRISELETFLEKYMDSILFFNYLVFGPFCFGSLFVGIKHANKLMYLCINSNPENKIFNYRFFI